MPATCSPTFSVFLAREASVSAHLPLQLKLPDVVGGLHPPLSDAPHGVARKKPLSALLATPQPHAANLASLNTLPPRRLLPLLAQ
jgi:hypothetical protein